MPGRSSNSKPLQYVGALAALLAIVGYSVFGWRFGETDDVVPLVLGGVFAVIAVGWALSRRT